MNLAESVTSYWNSKATTGVVDTKLYKIGPTNAYDSTIILRESRKDWIKIDFPIGREEIRSSLVRISFLEVEVKDEFIPRTPFGEKLLSLRKKAIRAGLKLLTEEEVLEEVKRRRGELENNEANLH